MLTMMTVNKLFATTEHTAQQTGDNDGEQKENCESDADDDDGKRTLRNNKERTAQRTGDNDGA
jgi:hypothetical protein